MTTETTSNTTLSTLDQISEVYQSKVPTFTDILGSAVNSKISEISSALSQLNPNSTEYALLTSVIDMLGDIASLVQTSGRRVRRDSSKMIV